MRIEETTDELSSHSVKQDELIQVKGIDLILNGRMGRLKLGEF